MQPTAAAITYANSACNHSPLLVNTGCDDGGRIHFSTNPTTHTLVSSSLQRCTSMKQLKQIQALVIRVFASEQHLYSKLLAFCTTSLASSLQYAGVMFEHIVAMSMEDVAALSAPSFVYAWNTMIRVYANGNMDPARGVLLYVRMLERSIAPNNFTFTFFVKASASLGSLLLGRAVHGHVFKFGLERDVYVQTALLHMYATLAEEWESAFHVFEKMPRRTAASWNTMIAAYARRGCLHEAQRLFDEMPHGCKDEQSWTVMVDGYARAGDFEGATALFEGMPVRVMKTTATWNAMISAYTRASMPHDALSVFRQMQMAGVKPDKITMLAILPACADLGALELGEWLHVYIDRRMMTTPPVAASSLSNCPARRDVALSNALMDMYSKCGSIEKAMKVFENTAVKSLVSWNTIITGLALHGRGEEALAMFREMRTSGVTPDDITFVGVLCACGHTGLVEEARMLLEMMRRDHGLVPKVEHYGCVVDALCRAGLLQEAKCLVETMPVRANAVILGTLLNGCRVHNNNVGLGERVLERLVELDPQNPGYYVLLSNMYATASRWRDVHRVRNFMKVRGVEKKPGCSSIEVGSMVHEFVAGDRTHPDTDEIHRKLEQVAEELHAAGYMADTSAVHLDLEDEEKADALGHHSEKLAVAFGLLNTNPGTPIRIVKNIRVCSDCHVVMKLISKLYDRDIILRDRNRFHLFQQGDCSCKDYW
ncbi:pentatricopeptide repeat-containing protein At5g66520 [Amborella trichopoda]|uniref:pentatricopeptide repeat-containing protein At5g66520 n=1 Tax=Amborella trichopoda TaxID=13333 RepID=UPI0005D2DD2F|nr:pentatricopeptide repeat-containing protein At5g66520 [Amborella trichopoda]|eukprot:XP_011628759.1 pentatricopeptide repeat-containing protein At5g66520 [Amborella trichopoda]